MRAKDFESCTTIFQLIINNNCFFSQNLKIRTGKIRMEKAKTGRMAILIRRTLALASRKTDVEQFVRLGGRLVAAPRVWEVRSTEPCRTRASTIPTQRGDHVSPHKAAVYERAPLRHQTLAV